MRLRMATKRGKVSLFDEEAPHKVATCQRKATKNAYKLSLSSLEKVPRTRQAAAIPFARGGNNEVVRKAA